MLSRYLPGEKIQAEMLNVKKHTELYGDDPLSPASCGIGYAFACSMAATPLLFMHLSSLDEESMNILEPLIRAYRGVMPEWTGGFIQPIGEIPNGFSWTGFQSRTDEKSGFLLLLREWNDRETAEIKLCGLKDVTLKLEKVLGSGEQEVVQVNSKGEAAFALKDAHGFVMYRYSVQ
jgi:hypothetical protein